MRPESKQGGLPFVVDEQAVIAQPELGQVQQTLFFPLVARARETRSRRPLLPDPKAAELADAIDFDLATFRTPMRFLVVIRTMILDWWVRQFLADHPEGTVVELGTGLNTRFERSDNGSVQWIDLDLPDTIARRTRPDRRPVPCQHYRYLLPVADPVLGRGVTLCLFRAAG